MVDVYRFLQSIAVLAIILLVNHYVFHQRYIANLQIALTIGGIHALYFVLALLQRRKARFKDGWHFLTPGGMDWLATVLSVGLTAFSLYIFHFVGSARADAVSQMQGWKWVTFIFGVMSAYCFFFSFIVRTRWNDRCIERIYPFGTYTLFFAGIAAISYEEWSQCLVLDGADGTRIRVPTYQNGAEHLVERIVQMAGALPFQTDEPL